MAPNRITHLGYAAVADGRTELVQPPKVLRKIPIRLSAGVGAIYFTTSLILLQSGGVAQQHFLPILGILAALMAFIYQTITLVAGWSYRRHLRDYARQGTVVFVPFALYHHVAAMHKEQKRALEPSTFDADLEKTNALVGRFNQEGFSPEVKEMAQALSAS